MGGIELRDDELIVERAPNELVDSQLQSARDSDLDADHYRRVAQAGRDR